MISALRGLLSVLIIPRYDYTERYDQLRARVSLLVGVCMVIMTVSLIIGGLLLPIEPDRLQRTMLYAFSGLAIALIIVAAVHTGRLRLAMWLLYLFFLIIAARSLQNGIGTQLVLVLVLPMLYAGIVAHWRGVVATFVIEMILLIAQIVGQSQVTTPDMSMLEPQNLPLASLIVVVLLLGVSALAGAFAYEVQRAISYSTRLLSQLRGVLDISQITAKISNLDDLLPRTVNYIRDRFAVYQVQIFLIDKERRFADLAASTGDAGRLLLERGYRLSLTSTGAIGQCIGSGAPVISDAKEERSDAMSGTTLRFPRHVNELLPATRSELVLPLIVGDLVIGALDLQSNHTDTFTTQDAESLRLLATQVALAINNAIQIDEQRATLNETRRMFLEAETNLRESQQINQRLTGQAWKDYMRQRVINSLGYTLNDGRLHAESAWTPLLERAVADRRPITSQGDNKHMIAVPVELRGQVIGAIEVEFEGNLQNVGSSTETIDMIQAVAQRLAVSVDNARLFEQTQELAQQEFEVNSISAKIQGVTDIQDLIKIALHELSSAIDADAASIRLGQLTAEPEAEAQA